MNPEQKNTASPCLEVDSHDEHLCQLKAKGRVAEVASRTSAPAFVCIHCGAEANLKKDLCNPLKMK